MKKLTIAFLLIGIILASGYIYLHTSLRKDEPATTAVKSPDPKKGETALDLRPKIIARLQQLVKEGSNGLYNLKIEKIEPDVLQSKLQVINASLIPDTSVLMQLDKNQKAPDDVFKISLHSLHIDGIGLEDLLQKNVIDLKEIKFTEPIIEVYHKTRPYNKDKSDDSATLYQRLMKEIKKISVGKIVIQQGSLINHDLSKKKLTRFNDVSIKMNDLLIDSSTQYDKNRFLFSKGAELSCKNYVLKTPDNLYLFKINSLSISATKHTLTALNVALQPNGNKQQFRRKLSTRKMMYTINIPQLELNKIDWWQLANNESLKAKEATVNNAQIKVYLDRSLPPTPPGKLNNFPHQLLMNFPLDINISRLNLHHTNLSYEELNPQINKSGKLFFDDINGVITNITNVAEQIKTNHQAVLAASAKFMHTVPMNTRLSFDLSKTKTGVFSADVHMGAMDNSVINPVAEPLGLLTIKKGSMKDGVAHVAGDNYNATGKVLILYNDLHLTPLKKSDSDSSSLKKKHVTSFIANAFVIKKDNPSKGEPPRNPDCSHKREQKATFFKLIWQTILVGMLKTVGISTKYAD